MSSIRRQLLRQRKQRIERRLKPQNWPEQPAPMLKASNVQYELSERNRGLAVGGVGAMHRLARHVGLVEQIDEHVEVLKAHLPYHESDHVLNIAYNVLSGGECLEDIELRRNDEVYLKTVRPTHRGCPGDGGRSGGRTGRRPATTASGRRSAR